MTIIRQKRINLKTANKDEFLITNSGYTHSLFSKRSAD